MAWDERDLELIVQWKKTAKEAQIWASTDRGNRVTEQKLEDTFRTIQRQWFEKNPTTEPPWVGELLQNIYKVTGVHIPLKFVPKS